MPTFSTFYLSRIINKKVYSQSGDVVGNLKDLVVDMSGEKPLVIAAKVKFGFKSILIDYKNFTITKIKGQYHIVCQHISETAIESAHTLFLVKHVMDKQIVDIEGRKLVRVNDLRLTVVSFGTFVVAVDIGYEGLLRRLSMAKPLKILLKPFKVGLPAKLILWDDVATIDYSQEGIKLIKTQSKLKTLHPSDLADILEDLDQKTQTAVFSSLDEEQAADVLEELETDAQVALLENLPVNKAADVLDKMPADEVADILDDLEDEKAEELLSEMEADTREDVRDLMEYPENQVGSLMTTDYIAFLEEMTVEDTIAELRRLRPESNTVYYLYVLDNVGRLVASVSLRDIVVSQPGVQLKSIMHRNVVRVQDDDKLDSLAEIISKYNLLAIPVVDNKHTMMGMVIIDDVIFTLLKARKRKI